MHFLDLTLPSIEENLALDEALLLAAEEGHFASLLRIWEWTRPAVVLGASCKLSENVNESACQDDKVPVLRRSSGGGTVLLGPGCLLFTLILPLEDPGFRDVRASYRAILDRVGDAFRDVAPDLHRDGTSDLVIGDRKISGNAQRRKRSHMLHHGSILYAFNIPSVERFLQMPPCQPDYREGRDHASFLTNIEIERPAIVERLRRVWDAEEELVDWPQERTVELVRDKYSQEAWTRRR